MPDIGRSLRRNLETAWAVGVIAFIAGVVSATVIAKSQSSLAITVVVSLSGSLVATHIAYVVDSSRKANLRATFRTEKLLDELLRSSGITRLMLKIENPFLRFLKDRLMKEVVPALRQLAGEDSNVFETMGEYMAWATPRILSLNRGGVILAVCGDKDWGDPAVKGFHDANCRAARAGVRVVRIFLHWDQFGFPEGEEAVIDQHCECEAEGCDIVALEIQAPVALELAEHYHLPRGFGMTYIQSSPENRVALIHWGLAGKNQGGVRLSSPLLADDILRIHKELETRATKCRRSTKKVRLQDS